MMNFHFQSVKLNILIDHLTIYLIISIFFLKDEQKKLNVYDFSEIFS